MSVVQCESDGEERQKTVLKRRRTTVAPIRELDSDSSVSAAEMSMSGDH